MELPFPIPASLAPGFVLSPMTEADVDAAGSVYYHSFKIDPANTYWWPKDSELMSKWFGGRTRQRLRDPDVRLFKITDAETGEMVAFSRWDIPKGSTKFGRWIGGDTDKKVDDVTTNHTGGTPGPAVFPEGANVELAEQFFAALKVAQKKHKTDDMLGLSLLATSPKYFKRGAAKALMLPMLDIADAEGRKSYLEATHTGKPVYERLGFRVVDTFEVEWQKPDDDEHGTTTISIMIRDPVVRAE